MSQYTYTLNQERKEKVPSIYSQKDLEKMTLFHLREICRKERLVAMPAQYEDREGLIRLIMKFRGRKEYRHINANHENGLEHIQTFLENNPLHLVQGQQVRIPGTIMMYRGIGINELDGYRVQSEDVLYEGNLLLLDERFRVYTCFYLQKIKEDYYLFKGRDVAVKPLEKHQYFILYFPDMRSSEFIYDCYYGNRVSIPGYIEALRIPLLDIQEKEIEKADLPLVIDFGSSNTTMGICLPDGSVRIATDRGKSMIPTVIGVKGIQADRTEYVFGFDALELIRQNYQDEDAAIFYDIKRWVSDAGRREAVVLKNGYKHQTGRKEMLRAYMDYLIGLAQQQFKCSFKEIQLLAPVRQKEKFCELFTQILPEYEVNCELDEGMETSQVV